MAIFPSLEIEEKVQIGDKTRLNATRSFVSADEEDISLVEIQPEAGADWIDVTTDKYLDWSYSTDGLKTVKVRVTTDGSAEPLSDTMVVVDEAEDALFSADSDLTAWEPNILNFIRLGRASYKDVHREAQKQILDWLDGQGLYDTDGNRLTAAAVVDVQEVKEWSKFLTLQIIFEGLSNAVDDVFAKKAQKYESLALKARGRSEVKLDLDGDGEADNSERQWIASVKVKRQ